MASISGGCRSFHIPEIPFSFEAFLILLPYSAIEALNKLTERYMKAGKKVHLKHLSPDCRRLLANAQEIIDVNVMEDPSYKIVMDKY